MSEELKIMELETKILQLTEELEEERAKEKEEIPVEYNMMLMTKMKEIEFQYSMMAESLTQYNKKYEKLKKEQCEILEKVEQKVNQLQTSNNQLKGSINQEVSTLIDRSNNILKQFKELLDKEFKGTMSQVTNDTRKTIEELEDIKGQAKDRFRSYYNRKKWIDYLIIGYMAATPIMFICIILLAAKK